MGIFDETVIIIYYLIAKLSSVVPMNMVVYQFGKVFSKSID